MSGDEKLRERFVEAYLHDARPVSVILEELGVSKVQLNRFPVSLRPASFSFSYPVSTEEMELCNKYVATGERTSTSFARYLEDLSAPHVGEVPEEVEDSGEHPAEEPLEATTIDGKLSELSVTENAHEFGHTAFWNNDLRALLRRGEDFVDVHTYGWDIIVRRVIDEETTIEATKVPGHAKDGQKEMFDEIVARVEDEGFSVDPTAEESEERVNLEDGQCEVRLGGYATYWNPSKLPIGDEHIALATVDNGGTFEWGDGGIGSFYIHPEDLAARNFDKVQSSTGTAVKTATIPITHPAPAGKTTGSVRAGEYRAAGAGR